MICTTLRKPFGNSGRIGRSVRRAVRMPSSDGRPSRRGNEPGIFPAAYRRSSKSTVRGKKSMPRRIVFATVAAAKTTVSPYWTVTAPPACFAYLPVSKTSGFPLITAWARVTGMWFLYSGAYEKTQGFPWAIRPRRPFSPSQTESPDDLLVAFRASAVQVGEQPSALSDHAEQAATTCVVVAGGAQMFGEVLDALGKERDLDLRRAGVLVLTAVRRDHLGFVRERR